MTTRSCSGCVVCRDGHIRESNICGPNRIPNHGDYNKQTSIFTRHKLLIAARKMPVDPVSRSADILVKNALFPVLPVLNI